MSEPSTEGAMIRSWLERARVATLSTLLEDNRARGAPFGSVVAYALDDLGLPFVVLSELAVHTKNLHADPRASLLVAEPGVQDPQAGWRVTLVGRLHRAVGDEALALLARHRAAFPGPPLAGFSPWRLEVDAIRFIAGFGKMGWLERHTFVRGDEGREQRAAVEAPSTRRSE